MRLLVYPYNLGSKSAKDLSNALGSRRVKAHGNYRHRPGDLIINWGNSTTPDWASKLAVMSMLNKPQYVRKAAEKIRTFEALAASDLMKHLPHWTTSQQQARAWLEDASPYGNLKKAVICRTLTRANSGRGIVMACEPNELVPAPLYTRYKPKTQEYRVHVHSRFGVMDVQQKRKKNDVDEDTFNPHIRSWNNGWVFCRENLKTPGIVEEVAELAINRLGLDFGAVDIGYHPVHGVGIYEVNTAPGIEGQTLANYANTFKRYLSA